jgi:hypothetical protein
MMKNAVNIFVNPAKENFHAPYDYNTILANSENSQIQKDPNQNYTFHTTQPKFV